MKTLLLILMLFINLYAEYGYESNGYESGKIDMHGGKKYGENSGQKREFGTKSFGFSALLDKNASKKAKEEKN